MNHDELEPEVEPEEAKRVPRKRNPDESRRRILDAAEHAFALRGFGGARLRDIAQEAGVHHALVHHYYGDKRGLLQEVIQRGLQRMSEAARATLGGFTLEETVRGFVGVLFDFCAENRGLLRIIDDAFRNRELVSFDVTHAALAAFGGPVLSRLKQAIEVGQKHERVRSDISADSLLLLGYGAIVYRFDMAESLLSAMGLAERNAQDLANEREHAIKYVLSAMRPQ
jgi:TetR/AcrR family transcriptional regulator